MLRQNEYQRSSRKSKVIRTLEKISQARKDAEAYIQSLLEKIDDESKR